MYELHATTPTRDDGRNCNCASIWCYWSLLEYSHHLPKSCTIKPVLGVTIKAIFKLSVCILQNCKGIGVRMNSPPQHLTTPLSDIACNSSLLHRSSAWINTHEQIEILWHTGQTKYLGVKFLTMVNVYSRLVPVFCVRLAYKRWNLIHAINHHIWRQNWPHYVWTSLCQVSFVNLLHSQVIWLFNTWYIHGIWPESNVFHIVVGVFSELSEYIHQVGKYLPRGCWGEFLVCIFAWK